MPPPTVTLDLLRNKKMSKLSKKAKGIAKKGTQGVPRDAQETQANERTANTCADGIGI